MSLHEKAIESMKRHINEGLRACEVTDRWPVFKTYSESVSKLSNEVLKHMSNWLTSSNVYSIFIRSVKDAIFDVEPDNKELSGKLSDVLGEDKIGELCDLIITIVKSVPRRYFIFFPLSRIDIGGSDIQISESISIVCFGDEDDVPGGEQGVGLLPYARIKKLSKKTTYIRIDVEGYAEPSMSDISVMQCLSMFKQITHLGILGKVFKEGYDYPTWGLLGGGQKYDVHAILIDHDCKDKIYGSTLLSRDVGSFVSKIELNQDNPPYATAIKLTAKGIQTYIESSFGLYNKILDAKFSSEEITAIRTAIEWAFDSNANDNDTVAFIQVCVGLESLLGENAGQESLTDTLADRCAYLLGNNHRARKNIKKNFKELYRLRSKVVHGRALRLKDHESGYLSWGKQILDKVIHKEIRYLEN